MIKKSSNTPVLHDKNRNDGSVTYAKPRDKEAEKVKAEKEKKRLDSYRKA